jgi:hypothetical protein
MVFAIIDIGERSSVNQRVEFERPEALAQFVRRTEIELRVVESANGKFFVPLADERGAEAAAGTDNDDFQLLPLAWVASPSARAIQGNRSSIQM